MKLSKALKKEKQEQIPMDGENPLYCASYIQTWENYRRMNEELQKQKVCQMIAARFAILMIVGTAFMAADKLQIFGWSSYCAAILLFVASPLIWRHNIRTQFQSAYKENDKEIEYDFYKDSFKLDSKNTTNVRKYSDLYQICEGAEYIYLLLEKNHPIPVPRDHGERDKFLLSRGKQQEKDKISPLFCCFFIISAILTAFFGMTEVRLPNQWLLQTWTYVICQIMPLVWIITVVLTCISWNWYKIPSVQKKGRRIVLRVLSVLFCGFIILSLGFYCFLFMHSRNPVKQNDNGTYTEHVSDRYSHFEYYLYQSEGPFFLRYLRPMTDSRDTDPSISESEWYKRMGSDRRTGTGVDTEKPERDKHV